MVCTTQKQKASIFKTQYKNTFKNSTFSLAGKHAVMIRNTAFPKTIKKKTLCTNYCQNIVLDSSYLIQMIRLYP